MYCNYPLNLIPSQFTKYCSILKRKNLPNDMSSLEIRYKINLVKWKKQQLILPNFFHRKTDIFSHFFILSLSIFIAIALFSCITKWESLTAKIEKWRKTKFGRIEYWGQFHAELFCAYILALYSTGVKLLA